MEILAILLLLAMPLVAWLVWENRNLHQRIVSLDEQLREAQHAKSKPSKAPKSDKVEKVIAADPELERDLDDARNEIKDLKKQAYDLKSETKGLKKQLKDATARSSAAPDSEMIFELREQIGELTTENARLEDELDEAKSRRPAPRPEPKREEKPEPPPAAAAAASSGATGADTESFRAKYEKEIEGLQDEVRDLSRKLKSTASNIDKQRRRADNNDRAYKITQRQYDAAQERVSLLEAQLEHAGVEPIPLAELKARAPEVSSEPARRTPAAIAADEAAAEAEKAEKAAAEAAAAEAATAELSRPASKPPTTPQPAEKEAPKPPPTPGAMVRKPAKRPEPEVGSTTVLSPMALASISSETAEEEVEASEAEEEKESTTVHRAKPITAADLSGSIPKPKLKAPVPRPKERDSEAYESGGHTAMLTPGALARSVSPAEEKSEPAADESGGHTAVLSAASLSKAVTGEQKAPADSEASEASEVEEHTAILSAGAFAQAESEAEAEPEIKVVPEESEGGRRPSSGLFGMPDDVMKRPADEEEDPVRSTQFAFPTQMVKEEEDDTAGTAKFAPVDGAELTPSRLGGGLQGADNPADKPVPDAGDGEKADDNRLGGGGRLGDLDLGDLGSAIDDAWGDLDID